MTQKDTTVVSLEGTLGLRDADALAGRLRDAIVRGAAVEIDTAALRDIDVGSIQLLAAAQKSAAAAGCGFAIGSPPGGPLRQALVRLGILPASEQCRSPADAFWIGGGAVEMGAAQ